MDVIEKLNRLRLERNLSVYRLAELSGLNQSTLANTFSRGTVPSITHLQAICEVLGVTLAQFFKRNPLYQKLITANFNYTERPLIREGYHTLYLPSTVKPTTTFFEITCVCRLFLCSFFIYPIFKRKKSRRG